MNISHVSCIFHMVFIWFLQSGGLFLPNEPLVPRWCTFELAAFLHSQPEGMNCEKGLWKEVWKSM